MSIHLQLERPHPAYCRVTFDRPPINAITADTVAELSELVDVIEQDHASASSAVRSACCSAAPPSRAPARRIGAGNLAALARRR